MSVEFINENLFYSDCHSVVFPANPAVPGYLSMDLPFDAEEVAGIFETLSPGNPRIFWGGDLDNIYIIYALCPVWEGGNSGEEAALRECYLTCLELARLHDSRSVSMPLISAGIYGFPEDTAIRTAISAIGEYLSEFDLDVEVYTEDEALYARCLELAQ